MPARDSAGTLIAEALSQAADRSWHGGNRIVAAATAEVLSPVAPLVPTIFVLNVASAVPPNTSSTMADMGKLVTQVAGSERHVAAKW